MSTKISPVFRGSKERYLAAFLLGFACVFISVLPVIIADGGIFVYYGDYNAQQMPFYQLANDAVRNGQLGWNWFTDLGSDFITSYSFYLTGSPFFWLTTILPKAWVVFSMPVLLGIKHGFAALTAYAYIRRFVRNKDAALIGALLYAYSGFQIFNIFFNHFQDVTAFFPLMLIAMEESVNNDRRGVFAAVVGLMGIINYFFFTGEAVFLVIYFLLRMTCSDFHVTWKKFFRLVIEALVGTLVAGIILVPSAFAILGNYRVSERLYGQDMVLYSDKSRIARIIQTFFMPSDVPARPNLFSSKYAKWASIGGYLPLFSMIGVITFIRERRKHWATRLFLICTVCAFIPILNCAFYAFNGSYYARWFFMPILILAMMTAHTLDNADADTSHGIWICGIMTAAFAVISLLPKKVDEKLVFFEFADDFEYFGVTLAITLICLITAAILFSLRKKGVHIIKPAVWLTSAACVICTISAILYGANTPSTAKDYIGSTFGSRDSVYEKVSSDNFFRCDISESCDNYPMIWGLPSMRCFQSVVCTSIMDFYDAVGVQRDVASRADLSHYTLRGLLSVKYFYDEKLSEDEKKDYNVAKDLTGFEKVGENEHFDIYENKLYVPMGFGYDKYISQDDADAKGESMRERLLMNALVLSDEQIEKYSDILSPAAPNETESLSKAQYTRFCKEKQECCSDSFTYDSDGFESEISLASPQLVFFSVPYSEGWTAEVNGKPADVEKVSYGFMAVKADAGDNTIVFHYSTPGLDLGIKLTIAGIAGLILCFASGIFFRRKDRYAKHTHYYDYTSCDRTGASEEYILSVLRKNNK